MQPVILLLTGSLIASTLVACVGINKTSQNMAVYDFGLPVPSESNQQITLKILLEEPVAAESLNHNKIRYRLNYQSPSRVFFYTESRWAGSPSELFSSKLSKMVNLTKTPMNCSLKLKIEAFDHVFQTVATSEGIVQLSALVIEKKSKKIISSQLITQSVTSLSPNAQGGTAALQQASENALKKAFDWGNMIADNSELCQ
jgi:cholesterol transport system auxiliary component